jgi:hypothetical protein
MVFGEYFLDPGGQPALQGRRGLEVHQLPRQGRPPGPGEGGRQSPRLGLRAEIGEAPWEGPGGPGSFLLLSSGWSLSSRAQARTQCHPRPARNTQLAHPLQSIRPQPGNPNLEVRDSSQWFRGALFLPPTQGKGIRDMQIVVPTIQLPHPVGGALFSYPQGKGTRAGCQNPFIHAGEHQTDQILSRQVFKALRLQHLVPLFRLRPLSQGSACFSSGSASGSR